MGRKTGRKEHWNINCLSAAEKLQSKLFSWLFSILSIFIWLAAPCSNPPRSNHIYICICYYAHTIYGLKVFDYFELYCNFDNQYAIDAVEQFRKHLMFYANMNGKYFWYCILPVHSCWSAENFQVHKQFRRFTAHTLIYIRSLSLPPCKCSGEHIQYLCFWNCIASRRKYWRIGKWIINVVMI